MIKRYEIAIQTKDWYKLDYVGPWGWDEITRYDDFMQALILIDEWALTVKGKPRKKNKIGIYDHEEDEFYTQERCLEIAKVLFGE